MNSNRLNRRDLIKGTAALAATMASSKAIADREVTVLTVPEFHPIPQQVPATQGICPLNDGAGLHFWDTGGDGPAVIFCHPATGSALTWVYQQPVFARAGFRVIGYSRRGRHLSPAGDSASPGTYAGDLNALVEHLGIEKFHIVGVAAGGLTVSDFVCSFPEKVLSVSVVCSLFGGWDPEVRRMLSSIRPSGFSNMPADFRELGPSYRAAFPEGVNTWLDTVEASQNPGAGMRQGVLSDLSWEKFQNLNAPIFLATGGADLYQPPSAMREAAKHLNNVRTLTVPEVGHALYWERPDIFNSEVINFISEV